MNGRLADCQINVPDDKQTGEFANAFRTVQDSSTDWFLDFLLCDGDKATVVSRIRVQSVFLPFIRERVGMTLGEVPILGNTLIAQEGSC